MTHVLRDRWECVFVIGGWACLTDAVASTGVKDTAGSLLGIFWKLVVFEEFRVRTQSQHLTGEGKKYVINLSQPLSQSQYILSFI